MERPKNNGPSNDQWIFLILTLFVFGSILVFIAIYFDYLIFNSQRGNKKKNDKNNDINDDRRLFFIVILFGQSFVVIAYLVQYYLFFQQKDVLIQVYRDTGRNGISIEG